MANKDMVLLTLHTGSHHNFPRDFLFWIPVMNSLTCCLAPARDKPCSDAPRQHSTGWMLTIWAEQGERWRWDGGVLSRFASRLHFYTGQSEAAELSNQCWDAGHMPEGESLKTHKAKWASSASELHQLGPLSGQQRPTCRRRQIYYSGDQPSRGERDSCAVSSEAL